MSDKDKIIEKIRKLLALSKSDNVHEAQLALTRANEMMTEHQLHMSQIDIDKMKDSRLFEGQVVKVSETYRSFMRDIAKAAGRIFDAQEIGTGKQSEIYYVGQKEDVSNANILFSHLFESWRSICSRDTKKWKEQHYEASQYEVKKYQISHGQGFASAVLTRATALASTRKSAVKTTAAGTALVVLKDQLIQQWVDDNTKSRKHTYKAQSGGYREGYKAGQQINLGTAIGEEMKALK
jgi:hypothetical protein